MLSNFRRRILPGFISPSLTHVLTCARGCGNRRFNILERTRQLTDELKQFPWECQSTVVACCWPEGVAVKASQFDVPEALRDVLALLQFGTDQSTKEKHGAICNVSESGYITNMSTPDKTADAMGMKELFKAVRTDACNIYRCKEKNKPSTTATTNTKVKDASPRVLCADDSWAKALACRFGVVFGRGLDSLLGCLPDFLNRKANVREGREKTGWRCERRGECSARVHLEVGSHQVLKVIIRMLLIGQLQSNRSFSRDQRVRAAIQRSNTFNSESSCQCGVNLFRISPDRWATMTSRGSEIGTKLLEGSMAIMVAVHVVCATLARFCEISVLSARSKKREHKQFIS
ncbi:hypothetical protein ANN_22185 [Periplaneta americana]|uniref:Uncharacterized protein n=1 Tax=Periplaneta americana TaxID=6978 RepID=A0ABQ8S873_PERAM|nr:hypothetical protein ANN_22185 [Periplaneta americana]